MAHVEAPVPGLALRSTLSGHHDWISKVGWSIDGHLLASGSGDKRVIVWDALQGTITRVLEGHSEGVAAVAWAGQRPLLASGSADRTVRIWDTEIGAVRHVLGGHTHFVRALAWIGRTLFVASGAKDGTVRIWDASSGRCRRVLGTGRDEVTALRASPDGKQLAIGWAGSRIDLVQTKGWTVRKILRGHSTRVGGHPGWVDDIAWTPSGEQIASAGADATVRIWNAESGKPLAMLNGHSGVVTSVSYSSDGRILASKSGDGAVALWSTSTWSRVATFRDHVGHSYWAPSLAFTPRSHERATHLVTLGDVDPKVLRVWDVDVGTILKLDELSPPEVRLAKFDLFISHASEDKEDVARPLYRALRTRGLSVWFDEAELTLGDSLRRQIDEGLAHCRYGVVILSPSFLKKEWPQRELDGLVARETISGSKTVLPIWHRVDAKLIARYSPTLADRLAASTDNGIEPLVAQIVRAIGDV